MEIYVQQLWRSRHHRTLRRPARSSFMVIRLDSLRARCVMTTFHPDTLVQDVDVRRAIGARFGGKLALNCAVEQTGSIALGDRAELLAPDG